MAILWSDAARCGVCGPGMCAGEELSTGWRSDGCDAMAMLTSLVNSVQVRGESAQAWLVWSI